MKINSVSDNNTNFKAKFVLDNKGILKKAYQLERETAKTRELLEKFSKIGKGQEVEFISYDRPSNYNKPSGIEVFNRTTGKTAYIKRNNAEPFWDTVLSGLLKDKGFFKPNNFWRMLTGQKHTSCLR